MSINIDNNVKNQGKAPAMITGLDAAKPNPGQPGRLYYATDTNIIYIDNGTVWVLFLESSGGTITVDPNYLPKADALGNLVNSALYENVTTGEIVWGNTDTQWGEFSLLKDANRVRFAAVNASTVGDDKTTDFRFVGYGGAILELIANVYATNANHINTNSFPNSLNLKAKKTNGKIVFIVGGDTSANVKGFINNNGNFILGSLVDNGGGAKLQINGNVETSSSFGFIVNGLGSLTNESGYFTLDYTGSLQSVLNVKRNVFFGIDPGTYYDPSAIIQIDSTTQGFILPRMFETDINAIVSPADGLMVYNLDQQAICFNGNGGWRKLNDSPM